MRCTGWIERRVIKSKLIMYHPSSALPRIFEHASMIASVHANLIFIYLISETK
jgi:hypothetical protein